MQKQAGWTMCRESVYLSLILPAKAGCQAGARSCSCKVRMSGLCKVEMSAFLGAGGPDGRGADRVERARAGAVERGARDYTRASAADRGRTPFAVERSAGAAIAAASGCCGGSRAGAWTARTSLESQDSRRDRAAQPAPAAAASVWRG